jgi:hypothetical protein
MSFQRAQILGITGLLLILGITFFLGINWGFAAGLLFVALGVAWWCPGARTKRVPGWVLAILLCLGPAIFLFLWMIAATGRGP